MMTTTTAPAPDVSPTLVFLPTDTGVAVAVQQLTLSEVEAIDLRAVEESADGAEFAITGCVTTWPNRWEVSGEWTPAPAAQPGETDWVVALLQEFGDVVGGGAVARVTLAGPGAFTIPLAFDEFDPEFRRELEASHEYRNRPHGPGAPCQLYIASGPQAVVSQSTDVVEPTVEFRQLVAVHSPESLQGVLEAMIDPGDHWLGPLAWHVGLEETLPMDVLYLRPGVTIEWMQITEESTCVGVQVVYVDEVATGQAAGCPPSGEPLDLFDPGDLTETDDGWTIGAVGVDGSELVPLRWEGAAPAASPFEPEAYLAGLTLPAGHRLVALFEFGDGMVALVEQAGDPRQFYPLELFTGGGEGYVGGQPGETWQGCARVDYSGGGYAIVLTEDVAWPVTYAGQPVEMIPAGDLAAGLIEGKFDRVPPVAVRRPADSGC